MYRWLCVLAILLISSAKLLAPVFGLPQQPRPVPERLQRQQLSDPWRLDWIRVHFVLAVSSLHCLPLSATPPISIFIWKPKPCKSSCTPSENPHPILQGIVAMSGSDHVLPSPLPCDLIHHHVSARTMAIASKPVSLAPYSFFSLQRPEWSF